MDRISPLTIALSDRYRIERELGAGRKVYAERWSAGLLAKVKR